MDADRSADVAGPRVHAVYVVFCGTRQSARSPHGTHQRLRAPTAIHGCNTLCCNALARSARGIRENPQ